MFKETVHKNMKNVWRAPEFAVIVLPTGVSKECTGPVFTEGHFLVGGASGLIHRTNNAPFGRGLCSAATPGNLATSSLSHTIPGFNGFSSVNAGAGPS